MSDTWESDEKWQALRTRFVDRLTDRFSNMRNAWLAVLARNDDLESLDTLFHLVHSLAGSGATFGYAELSEASRAVEVYIDPLYRTPAPLSGSELAELKIRLETLETVARGVNPRVASGIDRFNSQGSPGRLSEPPNL